MFKEAYKSVMRYLHNDPWYVSNIDGDALTPKIIFYLVWHSAQPMKRENKNEVMCDN